MQPSAPLSQVLSVTGLQASATHVTPLPSLPLAFPADSSTLQCLVTCDRATPGEFIPKQSGETLCYGRRETLFFCTVNTMTDSHPPFLYPLQALLSITNTPTKAARITNKKNVHQAQIKTVGCYLTVTQRFMNMKNSVPQQMPAQDQHWLPNDFVCWHTFTCMSLQRSFHSEAAVILHQSELENLFN